MNTTIAAFAVNLVLLFVSYRLVIHVGGIEILGLWSLLLAWIQIMRLGDVGITAAVVRFISSYDIRKDGSIIRTYLDTSLALNCFLFSFLGISGYLVLNAFLPIIIPDDEVALNEARQILPLMLVGFILTNISGLVLGGLSGLHRGYQAALLTIAGTLTQLALVVPLVPSFGLKGLAIAQIVQHSVLLTVGWGLLTSNFHKERGNFGWYLPSHFSFSALREMIGFSIRVQFANMLNGLFEPISKILVGNLGGLSVVGQYELAYKLVALPRQIIVAGANATTPAMTHLMTIDRAGAHKLYMRTSRAMLTKGVPAMLLAVLGAPIASWLWLGYVDLGLCIFATILVPGFIVNTVSVPAYLLGIATGRMRGNILASLGAVGAMLFLSISAAWLPGQNGQIAAIAFGLGIGGLLVKRINERLLTYDYH